MLTHRSFRIARIIDRAVPATRPRVLISGFWRSGTTWAQEVISSALGAKTIFEPLGVQSNPPFLKHHPLQGSPKLEAYVPMDFSTFNAEDLRYLDRAFRGYSPSRFIYTNRKSVMESLRCSAVVKMIRAQFILAELVERYDLHAVHVTRHPCAVVASLLNAKWNWTFEDIQFKELFRNTERSDIKALFSFDDRPGIERIAAYWATTEKQVASINDGRLLKVNYESLISGAPESFKSVLSSLGVNHARIETERDSAVTMPNRKNISKAERTGSWRKILPLEIQGRIEEIVSEIWPEGAQHWFTHKVLSSSSV